MAEIRYIPVGEYPWGDDYSWLRSMTCDNHRDARYLTKNPWDRGLHLIAVPKGDSIERTDTGECKCPFAKLVVVVGPGTNEEREMNGEKAR